MPKLTKDDVARWEGGRMSDAQTRLGAHPNKTGTWFATWAPHADYVAVVGEFNGWDPGAHPLKAVGGGLWSAFVRGAKPGARYKFRVAREGYVADKTDPYAFALEPPADGGSPMAGLASVVSTLDFDWSDSEWMESRKGPETLGEPVSIYEVHLGSWKHKAHGESLGYRGIAQPLADHVERLGFTHVELLPVMEHPYYGSWGYQVAGFFAPTFRYGTPEDFAYLVDTLHQRGIGVLLDWVPAHFAADPQSLVHFDGTPLYEYGDERMRVHPDWGTYVFDYAKPGVRNFLLSSARHWVEAYHIDGLRFDAVASMLYRDYSRTEWTPNAHGGRENFEAIDFLKTVNEEVFAHNPDGHDRRRGVDGVARRLAADVQRRARLPLQVEHGLDARHARLLRGGPDQPEVPPPQPHLPARLRALGALRAPALARRGRPRQGLAVGEDAGRRLAEGGQPPPPLRPPGSGTRARSSCSWARSGASAASGATTTPSTGTRPTSPSTPGVQRWVEDVFTLYRSHPALHQDEPGGFEWVDFGDRENSVVSYLRAGRGGERLLFVLNATPVPRENYRIGVPDEGAWTERLNSDAETYGGGGVGNLGGVETTPVPAHGRPASVVLTLPPLGVLVLEHEGQQRTAAANPTSAQKTAPPEVSGGGDEEGGARGAARRPAGRPPRPEHPPSGAHHERDEVTPNR